MSHNQFVDELVREYLTFRGFVGTLKALDNELKIDKDKGFRVDKILDHLLQQIYNYDLSGVREIWNHLETKIFSKLEHHFTVSVHKLENAIYKLYLVNASVNNKQDKITDFFTKMTPELLGQTEWKDWFVLPYIKNPEENPSFAVYYTRQWQETLLVSLHNFLAAVYQSMSQPTISSFEEDAAKMSNLQKENDLLRKGVSNMVVNDEGDKLDVTHNMDIVMDDFYYITEEIKSNENQSKMLKSLMRNIGAVTPNPKFAVKSNSVSGVVETKKHSSKKYSSHTQAKRSLLTDARPSGSRMRETRERDSSLDVTTRRSVSRDARDVSKLQEGSFLFLSQEEYSEHKAEITNIKFNMRGNTVASCDTSGNVKVWSISPCCKTIASFTYTAPILSLEWLANHDKYLLTGDALGSIRFLDLKEVKLMWQITSDSCPELKDTKVDQIVSNSSDSTFIIVASGKILVFDLKTKKLEKTLTSSRLAHCCTLNHNKQLLLVGCRCGTIELVDLRKNEVLEQWSDCGNTGPVIGLQFAVDYTSFYALTHNLKLYQRSLTPGKENSSEFTLLTDDLLISRPCGSLFTLDHSGNYLLTVGTSSGVIYKIQDRNLVKSLDLGGHKTIVTCLDWSFANQCATCLTASQDGKIRISTLLVETN